MRFSVVIAAYNAASTLGEAIGSVLDQTCQEFEVIVIDDGSSDHTVEVANRFAEDGRVQVYSQENAGPSAARNRGIDLSKGEYVSMLDSDDLWLPSYLAEMGRALEANSNTGFAYTDAWALEEASGRFLQATTATLRHHPSTPMSGEQFIAALMQHNFVHNSVTVPLTVFEQVGGYDPRMSHSEDYELWLRILNSGFEAVRVAGPLAIYRIRPGSLSHDETAMVDGLHTVYESVLQRHTASPNVKALAQARLDEIDRYTRGEARLRERVRRELGEATRKARSRWRLRSTPPPQVAEAFPSLGLGKSTSRHPTRKPNL